MDDVFHKLRTSSYKEFTQYIASNPAITAEDINGMICSWDGKKTPLKEVEGSLRLTISLHFLLGKRAEFSLSDSAVEKLLTYIRWAKSSFQSYSLVANLAILLLSLSVSSATVGVENHMCLEFLSSSPQYQLLLLPLIRRAFYVRGRRSLSAQSFVSLITGQVLNPTFDERLRCCAMVHASREAAEEFFYTQLLNGDLTGPKPMFSSAPHAVGVDGKKLTVLTILFSCDVVSLSQIHHCYMVSALNSYIDVFLASRVHDATGAKKVGEGKDLPLTSDMALVLVQYLHEVFEQLNAFVMFQGQRVPMFSHGKGVIGLNFIELAASEALKLTKRLFRMYPELTSSLVSDATSFLYSAMELSCAPRTRPPASEIPELATPDFSVALGAPKEGQALFSSHVILRCLEFQIEVSPLEEVVNFFNDIFTPSMWDRLVTEDSGAFPLQLTLVLLRNARKLKKILPQFSPRILWLLAQRPHTLMPVVKRLLKYLFSEATSLDMYFRIVYLPLLCFTSNFSPSGDDDDDSFVEGLWDSILDFSIDEKRRTTAFATFCLKHRYNFEQWDALQQEITCFTPSMMTCFRLVRPMLSEYFKCAPVPMEILSAVSTTYFFMIAPSECRDVVADYLLEVARWVVESCPELVLASGDTFMAMLKQEFLPEEMKCLGMQRWAAVVSATALSNISHLDATSKEAVKVFDVVHEIIWELAAFASAEMSALASDSSRSLSRGGLTGSMSGGVGSAQPRTNPLAGSTMAVNRFPAIPPSGRKERTAPSFILPVGSASSGLAGNHALVAPDWRAGQRAWVSPVHPPQFVGEDFAEHMHALIVALAQLIRVSPTVKDRGVICLVHIVKTLSRCGKLCRDLVLTATLCLKYLQFPLMSGVGSLPLHSLLGLQAR